MINNNRIVPVTATDLISLYGVILQTVYGDIVKVDASNVVGDFVLTESADNTEYLLSEPAKTIDIDAEIAPITFYFVPAYDFAGISVSGVKAEIETEIDADGRSLYMATLEESTVTVAKMGF